MVENYNQDTTTNVEANLNQIPVQKKLFKVRNSNYPGNNLARDYLVKIK